MVELDPVWKVLLRDVNVWGIFISIMLQDGPFLSLRMHIITNYHVTSYSMLFFTCKNILICTLLIYRLVVIVHETVRRRRELLKTPQPSEPPPTPPPEKDEVFEDIDEQQSNSDSDGRHGDKKNGVASSEPSTPMIDEQSIESLTLCLPSFYRSASFYVVLRNF